MTLTAPRTLLLVAAALSATGIALAGTVSQSGGGAIVVAGWALGLYALHAFGRQG